MTPPLPARERRSLHLRDSDGPRSTRSLAFCGVWDDDSGPCGFPASDVLIYCNPSCGGGPSPVCGMHLADHREEHLLA